MRGENFGGRRAGRESWLCVESEGMVEASAAMRESAAARSEAEGSVSM